MEYHISWMTKYTWFFTNLLVSLTISTKIKPIVKSLLPLKWLQFSIEFRSKPSNHKILFKNEMSPFKSGKIF